MNESVFESVNKAFTMLSGIRDSGSKPSNEELNYLIGLLEGTLKPYTMPQTELDNRGHKPWWKKLLP